MDSVLDPPFWRKAYTILIGILKGERVLEDEDMFRVKVEFTLYGGVEVQLYHS
jgi:hypothetical protein